MNAIIVKPWRWCPEGHTTFIYSIGDVLTGKAAAAAIASGYAKSDEPMQASLVITEKPVAAIPKKPPIKRKRRGPKELKHADTTSN